MADIMHFCAKNDLDFLGCRLMAETHFEAEQTEEEDDGPLVIFPFEQIQDDEYPSLDITQDHAWKVNQ